METQKQPGVQFGVFDSDTCDEIHAIPCYPDGQPVKPHKPSRYCVCMPWRDDFMADFFVHDMMQ